MACPHFDKVVDGLVEKRGEPGVPEYMAWTCTLCHSSGLTDWEETHGWQKAEALLKFYCKVSPEMMVR